MRMTGIMISEDVEWDTAEETYGCDFGRFFG